MSLVSLIITLFFNTSFAQSNNSESGTDELNKNQSTINNHGAEVLIELLKEAIISNDSSKVEQSLKLVDAIVKILNTSVPDNSKLNNLQSDEKQTNKSNSKKEDEEENKESDESDIGDQVFGLLGDIVKSTIGKKLEEEVTEDPDDEETSGEVAYYESEVDSRPAALNLEFVKSSMIYPEDAKKSNSNGNVKVNLLIGTDGSIMKVGQMKGPEVFYDEVRSKISSLMFTPAWKGGQTVKCWTTVNFRFEKKNGSFFGFIK